jgi:DNA-binding response OmpR family regulator
MLQRILVVHDDPRVRGILNTMLQGAGFNVTAVSTFEEARQLLTTDPPALLIADIRLGDYNGLQLALRCQLDLPEVRVIITHVSADAVFERAAADAGAAFVGDPVNNPQFLPSVRKALGISGGPMSAARRWIRKRSTNPIVVLADAYRAEVVDVSYGGIKLAFSNVVDLPATLELTLPHTEVPIRVKNVWSLEEGRQFWCGAEVTAVKPEWRDFVDSVD